MKSWKSVYKKALKRKGGEEALEAELPTHKSVASLARIKSPNWLSAMSKSVFQSGFSWKVVDQKWPEIDSLLRGFDVGYGATLDEKQISELMGDTRMIRHRGKIESIRRNAQFIIEVEQAHKSFGSFVAKWPDEDTVGLLDALKKGGHRLGGMTGQIFLRRMGKDTFMITGDVVRCLTQCGVIDKSPTSKKALRSVQDCFNTWREESGRPLCELSKIAACSVG